MRYVGGEGYFRKVGMNGFKFRGFSGVCSTLCPLQFFYSFINVFGCSFLHLFRYTMTDPISSISKDLVVLRGDDLDSDKTSTLTGLLGDERHETILECFQKHGWDDEQFSCAPNFSEFDELLCTIDSIPRTPSEPSEIKCVYMFLWYLGCLNTDVRVCVSREEEDSLVDR